MNQEMKREKLWTRNFILATLTGLFSALALYATLTTMAVYSTGRFGVGEGLAGFTASVSMIAGIAGRVFAGRYMDQIGRRKLALTMGVLNAAACALYLLPGGLGLLFAVRCLHGITFGALHNTMATAVIDFIPPSRRAEGIGMYTLNFTIATALGPWLGMALIAKLSYSALWIACFAVCALALAVLAAIRFVPVTLKEEDAAAERPSGKAGLSGVFEKSALPLSFMIILLSLCYGSVTAFLETYTDQLGKAWLASTFFVIYGLFILVTRPMAGRLIDRRGENFVMPPAIIIYAVSLAALGIAGAGAFQSGAAPLIIAAAFLMAIGFGTVLPMGQAISVKRAEPRQFGRITATYFVFSDAGMGVGALVMGLIAANSGFAVMYLTGAAVALAALALYWRLHGRFYR